MGLYVHVPFCVSHCPYCDFVVVAGRETRGPTNRLGVFVEALETELALRADALDELGESRAEGGDRPPLETLYFGGGTPSLLPAAAIARLMDLVKERFGLAGEAEVTLEVNPGPAERGDMVALHAAGVTRVSIGAQSMDRAELRTLGRRHAPDDAADTVRAARDAGVGSVSIDLLYDVPGQSVGSWARTLDRALDLEPDHVSAYALTLDDPEAEGLTGIGGDHLPTRPGARRWRERAAARQDEDRAAEMYQLADERLGRAGFAWYEISNWARPGHRSRHNQGYWRALPFEGVGPGAHAYDGVTRRWNGARLDGYLGALVPPSGPPGLPPGGAEAPPATAPETERAILALRTSAGLPGSAMNQPALEPPLAWALERDLLERTGDDRLVLTTRGRLLSNELFARLA